MANDEALGAEEASDDLDRTIALKTTSWKEIYTFLKLEQRIVTQKRTTNETDITHYPKPGWKWKSTIDTGIAFFDHMLDQLARHGGMDLELSVQGDLEVDEHHTIEDTAIVLGEAFASALRGQTGDGTLWLLFADGRLLGTGIH